jgi:CheY-like chemotaxis protein
VSAVTDVSLAAESVILLVDDSPSDAHLAMRALVKGGIDAGIRWVQDGVEALDFVNGTGAFAARDSSELPKLVLLDLNMPRRDGFDVLRALKGDERTRPIPVVMLTSSSDPRDVAECYRIGANGYVTKPTDIAELSTTIVGVTTYWLNVNRVPS